MYDLKQGTLKFLLNASIDTLPTAANLKRWKKSGSDLCKLCKRRQTTAHILNGCKVALDSGRYTWRHNCVVSYILNSVDKKFTMFSIVKCFEVSSKGFLTTENHSTLNTLHRHIRPGISQSQFKNNPTFLAPPYLLPPLVARTRGPERSA